MRKLQFRFWDIKNKCFAWANPSVERLSLLNNTGYYELYGTIDYTITQFTGQRDKNGRDIYEGDIVTTMYDTKGVVEFVGNVNGKIPIYGWTIREKENYRCVQTICEVIGNIFENPELIGEK